MVGVDPALVLCRQRRCEYRQTLGDKRGDFHVMLVHEWLPTALKTKRFRTSAVEPWYLFGHCTEVTALPGAPRSGRPSLRPLRREAGER